MSEAGASSVWRGLLARLGGLFGRRRLEGELDDELRFHLEMEIEKNVALGMSREEAGYAAERAFGGVLRVKEELRTVRGLSLGDALGQDLRSACRALRRQPGATLAIVLTLALGVGANTAVFNVVREVLLRPLPFPEASSIVLLRQRVSLAGGPEIASPFSVAELEDFRRGSETLASLVEYHSMPFILLGREDPERVATGVVSADFFDVLGVTPVLGRTFLPGEDEMGAPPVLVLSHEYWQRRHGADPAVVGRVFEMNDRPHRVVGVLPPLPRFPDANDVFMPTSSCPFRSDAEFRARRDARMMGAIAKLAPGSSAEAAAEELSSIAAALKGAHPAVYGELDSYRVEATPLGDELTRRARPVLLLLFITAGFVLLIACSNVLNLTMARLASRDRELSLRAALGADGLRLGRQIVVESMLLAVLGGALGLAFAWTGRGLLLALAERISPSSPALHLDGTVVGFALVLSVAAGLGLGLAPAVAGSERFRLLRHSKTRPGLVVAQLAISLVLLVGAGLTITSLHRLENVDAGFETERVLTMLIDLDWTRYDDAAPIRDFHRELLSRLSARPGIVSAALGRTFPLRLLDEPRPQRLLIEGRKPSAERDPFVDFHAVTPGYFGTIGVPVLGGRSFVETDDESSHLVAIVNRAAAQQHWPAEDPVGIRISGTGERWYTIVGVVGDVRQYGLATEAPPSVYVPLAQVPLRVSHLLVRTATEPLQMVDTVASVVHEIDPGQAVAHVDTLEGVRRESLATPRLTAALLGIFAGLALAIAAVGLSGSLGLAVRRRSSEIGLRLALGALPRDVSLMVLRQGLGMLAAGLTLGLPASILLSTLLSGLLYDVEPRDPVIYSAVCLFLLLASAAASLVPARRATAIDPIATLRAD